MPNFKDWIAETVKLRPFSGPYGKAFLQGTLGRLFDDQAEGFRNAVRSAFVGDAGATAIGPALDALGAAGHELSLPRYPSETLDQYNTRLQAAWNSWTLAGTEANLIAQLALGGVTATIKHNRDWNWDGHPENWSRFWIIITGHPWTYWQWGDGHHWGGGQTWGSTATAAEVRDILAIVHKWKPGHWRCENIIVVMDGTAWAAGPPDGTWADPANRNPAALYWDG